MNVKNTDSMNFIKPAAECFRTSMEAGIKFQQDTLRMMTQMMENWADFVNQNMTAFEKTGVKN
jgi:hypothetical protein